ncbi:hypothetical protein OROGR_028936 [Orobanche gracilis]
MLDLERNLMAKQDMSELGFREDSDLQASAHENAGARNV